MTLKSHIGSLLAKNLMAKPGQVTVAMQHVQCVCGKKTWSLPSSGLGPNEQ